MSKDNNVWLFLSLITLLKNWITAVEKLWTKNLKNANMVFLSMHIIQIFPVFNSHEQTCCYVIAEQYCSSNNHWFFRAIVFNLSVIYNKIVHQAASSWHHDNYFAGLGNYLINFLPLLKTIVFIVYQIQNRTNYEVVIMCTSLYPGFYLRSRLAPPLHPPNL